MAGDTAPVVQQFRLAAQRAWARGLVAGSGGNMSVRVPGSTDILIKPSGVANIDCTESDLVRVQGTGVVEGLAQPSSDVGFHLAIYAARPDVGGIVHAHSPWATALPLLGYDELPLLTPQARDKLGEVPVVPYSDSGTAELNSAVGKAFSHGTRAVLLGSHGVVAAAAGVLAAEELCELVEETAHIATVVHLAGRVAPPAQASEKTAP